MKSTSAALDKHGLILRPQIFTALHKDHEFVARAMQQHDGVGRATSPTVISKVWDLGLW